MKRNFKMLRTLGALGYALFAIGLVYSPVVQAASVALATEPLTKSSTATVLPNLMFILDGSGSMDYNYLPDWVGDNAVCKNPTNLTAYNYTCVDSPLFKSPNVNGVYYNPAIRYTAPVNAAGVASADQTTWTSVKNDAYNIQDTGSTNLVTGFPDVEWCTSIDYSDCLRNGNYILPGTVNGKNYTVQRVEYCTSTAYTDCLNPTIANPLPGRVNNKNYNVLHNPVKATGTGLIVTGTTGNPVVESRTFGPHYYQIVPSEYCDSPRLNNCQATKTTTFSYEARVRWCTNAANSNAGNPPANTCQGLRTGAYKTIRFPTKYVIPAVTAAAAVPESGAFSQFTISTSNCGSGKGIGVASIKINGVDIIASPVANQQNASNLAAAIRAMTPPAGYSFSGSGTTVRIDAPAALGNVTYDVVLTKTTPTPPAPPANTCTFTTNAATPKLGGYVAPKAAIPASPIMYPGSFVRTDIVDGTTYPKSDARTDCAGSVCTYTEEMTNFANWWTYYQTRMQTMKTSVSQAFKPIDNRYRVGFIDLYGNNYLPIDAFTAGTGRQKDLWYKKLFAMSPSGSTPLRSALARVGLIFAGKNPTTSPRAATGLADPMQYSCQQNFALMTTDGYWNGDTESQVKGLDGQQVGDVDGGDTPRPMYEGPTASSNTLADVAKYYYDNDLRTTALGNCTGALGSGVDTCLNNVFVSGTDNNLKQHMTTLTLGLGVDGSLFYTSDYKTAASGDYANIVNGAGATPNWPVPANNTETAVDDLWHAAVNGQGTYFSAKDPNQLTSGLNGALSAITSKLGAGSAAATSSLNPVANNNFAYVASYNTVKWTGNLTARTINLTTGNVSESPLWCVEDTLPPNCASPGTVVASTDGNSTAYFCQTPNSTADTCTNGTLLDGGICKVEVPVQCTGVMRNKVSAATDTRKILIAKSGGLVDFTYDTILSSQKTYFNGTGLSQYAVLSDEQKALVGGANLVSYLRGQNGYEDRTTNDVANRLYRYREATLGDITESQPEYSAKPRFKYTDTGYAAYAATSPSRVPTVFVGANDGMMHAFNATDGTERWAFIPKQVAPNLWKLADKNYSTIHTNYANGRPIVWDVYDKVNAVWRTILVAGLNGGGRGYYALDVTDPTQPTLLWEIDQTNEANMGYSYAYPILTKKINGDWVVLVTSGYNNINPGDGKGYLYVLNALTGTTLSRIPTLVGDATTPSGLGKISSYANDAIHDNTTLFIYGGDLLGNVWRFDINAQTVVNFATLKDASSNPQPITTAPELGVANGKRMIFVGTGKYLEIPDLTNTQTQSLYAIKDNNVTASLGNPRGSLVQQTLGFADSNESTRKASKNAVDLSTTLGWFIDFPDSGERVVIEPRLDSGLLIAATTVPANNICSPGGYGWLNYFNYLTGTNLDNITSQKFNAPIVGINILYTPDGVRHVSVVTSDDPTPQPPPIAIGSAGTPFTFKGKRVVWRELIP